MEENKHVVSMKEMTLLIQEIGKGLIQLRNDRKGLRQEINKYEGRDSEEAQKEVKQLEEELLQVNGEIDEKEQEIRTVQEIALAKLNIDEKISDAESEHIKMTNEYEKQKQELLRQRQEQKMTLITETETGLNSLRTSREQLNNELENYRNKNFEQGIKELEGDLVKIDEEIGLKEQKLNSLQAGEFQQE